MLYINLFNDTNVLLFTYMLVYNLSLLVLFWTLFNSILTNFKTLQSFQGFSFNSFYLTVTTLIIFSMAGVPPFIGFFSKLFILTLLVNNSFTLLYALFFITLFVGLFFYVQNIRFLHSTNTSESNFPSVETYERVLPTYYYTAITFTLVLVLGLIYVDDLLLVLVWVLI